jgi:hypothetical protein
MGYKTDYPLAFWSRTIVNTEEINIKKPNSYKLFKHANCIGCIKAGKQQWYIVYCLRSDIWEKAKWAEEVIGYSILKNSFLEELEEEFEIMKNIGICPTEKVIYQKFWVDAKSKVKQWKNEDLTEWLPCECSY